MFLGKLFDKFLRNFVESYYKGGKKRKRSLSKVDFGEFSFNSY